MGQVRVSQRRPTREVHPTEARDRGLWHKVNHQKEYRCLLSVRVLPFVQTTVAAYRAESRSLWLESERRHRYFPAVQSSADSSTLPPDEPQKGADHRWWAGGRHGGLVPPYDCRNAQRFSTGTGP